MARYISTNKCYYILIMSVFAASFLLPSLSFAQQHSYAPNTDNDGGDEIRDCMQDMKKYCVSWSPLLFELENCLQDHMAQLTSACRSHLQSTDFKKYHNEQNNPLGF